MIQPAQGPDGRQYWPQVPSSPFLRECGWLACGTRTHFAVSSCVCVRLTEQAAYQQRPGPRRTQAYAYQPKGHLTN